MSCNESKKSNSKKVNETNQEPVIALGELLADYNTWWSYHYNKINLTLDFLPLDESSNQITKDEFLNKLTTGKFIPVEIKTTTDSTSYKLFKLDKDVKNSIVGTIKSTSSTTYKHF